MVTPSASPPPNEQRRLARAGRSPVSLQRQTNARLARHRHKIKQQRLDQLASMALMEREQLARERRREQLSRARQGERRAANSTSTASATATGSSLHTAQNVTSGRNSSSNNNSNNNDDDDDYLRIDIEEILTPDGNQSADQTASQNGFLRDLLGRLSGRSTSSSIDSSRNEWRRQQQQQQQQQAQDFSEVALIGFDVVDSADQQRRPHQHQQRRQQQQRQQQQVPPLGPSQSPGRNLIAIETCDNQENTTSSLYRHHRQSYRPGRTSTSAAISNQDRSQQLANNIVSSLRQQQAQEQTAPPPTQMASSKRHLKAFKFTPGTSSLLPDAASLGSAADSSSSSSSSSSLSLNKPFCKICHLSSNRNGNDKLISPCKCSGTMQFVHCGCLLKWLEISNRSSEKAISCELCSHEYTWHKRFNYNHVKLPRCSAKDMVLHLVFVLALFGMICCALAPLFRGGGGGGGGGPLEAQITASPVMMHDVITSHTVPMTQDSAKLNSEPQHQQQQRGDNKPKSGMKLHSSRHQQNGVTTFSFPAAALPSSSIQINNSKLASDEKFVLACAALFFVSFFIAIYAQTKTRDTLYGLIVKFSNMNLTYFITEYDHGTNQACQSSSESSTTATTATGTNTTSSGHNAASAARGRNGTNQYDGINDYHYDQMTDYSQTPIVDEGVTSSATTRDHNDASQHTTNKNGTDNNKHLQR